MIDWGETPHPTESLPDGVELVSLQGVHPSPRSLDPVLGAIDADLVVEEGPEPGLEAVFRCPSGTVTLR